MMARKAERQPHNPHVAWIDFSRWDLPALAAAWRTARPFPHVVIDGLLAEDRLAALRTGVAQEPHQPNTSDLFEMMGSGATLTQPVLCDFHAAFGAPDALAAVSAICGHRLGRVDMRSYVYLAGSFLLPHTDCQAAMGRLVAYAYYLMPRESSAGGELELFSTTLEAGQIVQAEAACRIEPEGNRIVLFEVSPASLHQVREVTAGGRVSLAGWFHA